MRQLALAILAIVIGALVALAVTTAVLWPRPVSCGTGGGGVSNAEPVYGGGSVANATYQTVSFPASASVAFSWSTPNGTAANFRVVGPGGPTLYSATGPPRQVRAGRVRSPSRVPAAVRRTSGLALGSTPPIKLSITSTHARL